LGDPNLTDERRAELKSLARKIESEMVEKDPKYVEPELRRELEKVVKAQEDPNLNEAQKYEFRAMEAKLRSQLYRIETGKYGPIVVSVGIENKDDWDGGPNGDTDSPRYRQAMERLKRSANISMEQAMGIALASHPGKLVEKNLGSINGQAVYRFFIIDAAATPESNVLVVDVSGLDGRVIKTGRANIGVSFKNPKP